MYGSIEVILMLPMMTDMLGWYRDWRHIGFGTGSLIVEKLPEDVLWVDEENIFVVDTFGTYLLGAPNGKADD